MLNGQADSNSEHLTVGEVSSLHRVSRWTVSRWIARGELRAIKKRGRIQIPRDAYDEFLRSNTEEPNRGGHPMDEAHEPRHAPPAVAAIYQHANPNIDGAKLRELRQAQGLNVTAAAALIGISVSYLSLIERELRPTVSPRVYARICRVMKVKKPQSLLREPATEDSGQDAA